MVSLNQKGFSLIEVLVVLSITLLLSVLGYSLIKSIGQIDRSSDRLQEKHESLFAIKRSLSLLALTQNINGYNFLQGNKEGLSFVATLDHQLVEDGLLILNLNQQKIQSGEYLLKLSYQLKDEKQDVVLEKSDQPWVFKYADKQSWKNEWKQHQLPQKIKIANPDYPTFIRRLTYAK